MSCIFCKIINQEIPATIIYQDDQYLVFEDIHPKAPIHYLIIPVRHIENFHLVKNENDKTIIKNLFDIAWRIINENNLIGCQLHINSGTEHNQLVPHLHLHLLSKGTSQEKW